MKKRRLFCEISPLCYKISLIKEYILRDIKDIFSGEKIAKLHSEDVLPVTVKSHRSVMLRRLEGVEMKLQENKQTNLEIAASRINGIIIRPNETFSFWRTVGKPTQKCGFKEGLTISQKGMGSAVGGGLCQMANLIHWLILNSPLEVTELHHHSDALFPDSGRRVPFGTGTSVFYKNVDYRFKNTSPYPVQIIVFTENGDLCGELRSKSEFPERYKITEENLGYTYENGDYFRNSKVYRHTIDRKSGETLKTELILNNHSKVMYDHSLIPQDEIRKEKEHELC